MERILGAACFLFAFSACQRSAVGTPHGLPAAQAAHAKYELRCYYQMIGCHGTNGDCLPDVVVERPCEPVVSSVFTALDTKDKVKIAEAFATGRDVLIKYVSEAYVDGVIAGTLYAESDYGTETARMLLIRSKEDVLAVYPLLPEKS